MVRYFGVVRSWELYFIVRMSDGRYLRLDDEGEAERIEDGTQATRFQQYRAAKQAAWAFQAEPYEVFVIEAKDTTEEGEPQ